MSTANPLTSSNQARGALPKSQRILSCVQCQRRKVRCDRRFPCANCVRAAVDCVAGDSVAPRPRRRRFPERELLERLRYYEGLLRQNGIDFEPLHQPAGAGEHALLGAQPLHDVPSTATIENSTVQSKEEVDIWRAIGRLTLDLADHDDDSNDDDDTMDDNSHGDNPNSIPYPTNNQFAHHRDTIINNAWNHRFRNEREKQAGYPISGPLFFNPALTTGSVDLTASHPEQVQIFKLWQIYLENVNPLLKVTHTPTLQPRIIDAISNLETISPALEALLFGIYCVSILSLADDECVTVFRSPRKDLLMRYQSACQQALQKCSPWKSSDLDGITAMYLYLISVKDQTDPRSLSCTLAVAIRIAQRMGMHRESFNVRHTALEAEMRRRLWWSLAIFDHRVCELSDIKNSTLTPTWDCRIPLNANDFEIRPDMKILPAAHQSPTEAIFTVVRSDLFDLARHSAFHLNFVNPALKALARTKHTENGHVLEVGELSVLEIMLNEKYFATFDLGDPLHYMTIWTARASLARHRLLEYYSTHSPTSARPTGLQRSAAISHALSMLDCDTKLRTSSLTQKYLWFVDFHFPALAYIHLLNCLIQRPAEDPAGKCWAAMSENYEALIGGSTLNEDNEKDGLHFLFIKFAPVMLLAWETREAWLKQQRLPPELSPRIVTDIRNKLVQMGPITSSSKDCNGQQSDGNPTTRNANSANPSLPTMPVDLGGVYADRGEQEFLDSGPMGYHSSIPGQAMMDINMDQFLNEIDWRWIHNQDI